MRIRFSEISADAADELLHRMRSVAPPGGTTTSIRGAWIERKLVVDEISPSSSMLTKPSANPEALVLTVPLGTTAPELSNLCVRFGEFTEMIWRSGARGRHDQLVSDEDGQQHMVAKFDHAARCGHIPRRWLHGGELGAFACQIQWCPRCNLSIQLSDLKGP